MSLTDNLTHVMAYQRDEELYNLFFESRWAGQPTVEDLVTKAKKLQGQGADINMICKGTTGTLLINAIKRGRFIETIALLICGANVHARNDEGESSFSCACNKYLEVQGKHEELMKNAEETIILLARCGADIHEKNSKGKKYLTLITSPATQKRIRLAAKAYREALKNKSVNTKKASFSNQQEVSDLSITVTTNPIQQDDLIAPERKVEGFTLAKPVPQKVIKVKQGGRS